MAKQTVFWSHPVLGIGRYSREARNPRDAAEECADIFAGQPIRIKVWEGEHGEAPLTDAHWEIACG